MRLVQASTHVRMHAEKHVMRGLLKHYLGGSYACSTVPSYSRMLSRGLWSKNGSDATSQLGGCSTAVLAA